MRRGGRLAPAVVLALTVLVLPLAPSGDAHMCTPDPVVPVTGSLLVPQGSGLARINLASRAVESLPVLPSTGVLSQVSRASDGTRLAVARFSRREGESIGGSDILVTTADGGAVIERVERTQPGEILAAPIWHPQGGLLFERSTVAGGAGSARIEWRRVDGTITTLVERGSAPSISRDGASLAYLQSGVGDSLKVRDLANGADRVVVPDTAFFSVAFPRFSPNGEWVAFAAVSDAIGAPGTRSGRWPLSLGPGAASAHGLPWDAWAVRVADGSLVRLSSFYDDDPAVAWSPDGQWVAMYAGESINVLAVDGSASYCVLSSGGYGGFEWIE